MVESTTYPVSEIPYPAVVVCNFNRVNWAKVQQAQQRHLPNNASAETVAHFYSYLKTLSTFEYGSFTEFGDIQEWNITELDHIDLLELYEDVAFTCEELFDSAICWWRNKYVKCCDYFHRALSEYGLCFAFNSAVNQNGKEMVV